MSTSAGGSCARRTRAVAAGIAVLFLGVALFFAISYFFDDGRLFFLYARFGWRRSRVILLSLGIALVAIAVNRVLGRPFDRRRLFSRVLRAVLTHGILVAAMLLVVGVSGFALLKVADRLFAFRASPLPGHDIDSAAATIRTLELYPYDGWHIQADFHHQGPMPWERPAGRAFDVRSGDMGFFVDFDLEKPPQKAAHEFRIILIGGSGAQGWGATTNGAMLYRQLEARLNRDLAPEGATVRVINLAMGSSLSYQNFIALNRWGHALEPDLILSYSGRNDFVVPLIHEPVTDAHYFFGELNAFVFASRGSTIPSGQRWLYRWFPNLMTKTNLGVALKLLLDYDGTRQAAAESYRASRGLGALTPRQGLDEVAVPLYVQSLQSIKRDFQGIPICVAWQALSPEEIGNFEKTFGKDFYDGFFSRVQGSLEHYVNDQWYFENVHRAVLGRKDGVFATHLDDAGHRIIADMLAERLEPVIREQRRPHRP